MKTMSLAGACVILVAASCGAPQGESVGSNDESIVVGNFYNFGTLSHPGSCMDARARASANGTQIQEWTCNGTPAQSFKVNGGGGVYTLVNTDNGKCVDVNARGTANGTKVQLWDCNGTPA